MAFGTGKRRRRTRSIRTKPKPQDTKRIEAQIRQEKARRGKPIQQKIDRAEKEMAQLSEIQTACETVLAQEDAYHEANKENCKTPYPNWQKSKHNLPKSKRFG